MKSKILKEKSFKPFQLIIDIENESEAISLWHNLNVNLNCLLFSEYWKGYKRDGYEDECLERCCDNLKNELQSQGIILDKQ